MICASGATCQRQMLVNPFAAAGPSAPQVLPENATREQIVAAVKVPVIAAGGIGDGRGIAAALMLGAAGVQIGTAYLGCPEATISQLHRAALAEPGRQTVIADVLSGRPARAIANRFIREQGPVNPAHPAYPLATPALSPLRDTAHSHLLATLRAYLESGGSVVLTAQALGVHRNTVTTRVQQVRDRLGVDLDDPSQRLALQVACRALGE